MSAVSHPGQTDICGAGDVGNGAHAEKLAVGFRCDVVLNGPQIVQLIVSAHVSGREHHLSALADELGVGPEPTRRPAEARGEHLE